MCMNSLLPAQPKLLQNACHNKGGIVSTLTYKTAKTTRCTIIFINTNMKNYSTAVAFDDIYHITQLVFIIDKVEKLTYFFETFL